MRDAYAWAACTVIALTLAASLFARRAEVAAESRPLLAAGVLLALAGGAYAAVRYTRLQRRARHFAAAATCPHCACHGRFAVIRSRLAHGQQRAWMDVRCADCGRDWRIEAPEAS